MNGIGMYQNYMTSFQEMSQINHHNDKRSEQGKKKQTISSFEKPGAVYKRTSTDEDIQKLQERQQGNNYQKKAEEKKTEKNSLENFTISQNKKEVKLSDKAQKLLEQLKEKYDNMDFFVAGYGTKKAQQYLNQGTKDYSVVIDPETLEKMAEDEETFQKYDSILSNAGDTFEQVKEQLGEDADKVTNFGMNIDKDGKVTLFAELDKQSVKRAETQKKMREEKAAEKKAQKKKEEEKQKAQKTKNKDKWELEQKPFRVTGTSIEELTKAIKEAIVE